MTGELDTIQENITRKATDSLIYKITQRIQTHEHF